MMRYQWGIRYRRTGEIYRYYDEDEAQARRWFDPDDWSGLDPHKMFELVRRPISDWEPAAAEQNVTNA